MHTVSEQRRPPGSGLRPGTRFALFLAGAVSLLGLLAAAGSAPDDSADRLRGREAARELMLTDLALFTEARYTRHPSQADFHAAFQDHPAALERFPSGSFAPPPQPRGPRQ